MSAVTASMLVYATRYALGRRSGAAQDVERAVAEHLDSLRWDRGCLAAIIRDISGTDDLGDPCDEESWRRILRSLQDTCDAVAALSALVAADETRQP